MHLKTFSFHSDLIAGNSFQLRVENQEQFFDSEDDGEFEETDLDKYEEACEKWRKADFVDKSFDEVRASMTEIGMDIYKKVMLEGFGEPIPMENAKVTLVYSVFFEKKAIPVDSTLLTGKNFSFITGKNAGLLIGIEHAVMSMKAQEQAQFIVPWQLLYGEHGVPPRIPPKQDGLILIRIISVQPGCGPVEMSESEMKNFSNVKKKVEELRQKGRQSSQASRYNSAIRAYNEATKILERVETFNEEEDEERNNLLVMMLINAGMMYNKLMQPKSACLRFNEAQRYYVKIPRELKGKLMFHKGRALRHLGEFQRARQCLTEAHRNSSDCGIAREIHLLDQEEAKYNDAMSKMMQKALNLQEKVKKTKVSNINEDFRMSFTETLRKFLSDDKVTRQTITEDITKEQRDIIDSILATEDNVMLHVLPTERTTRYCLVKKM